MLLNGLLVDVVLVNVDYLATSAVHVEELFVYEWLLVCAEADDVLDSGTFAVRDDLACRRCIRIREVFRGLDSVLQRLLH